MKSTSVVIGLLMGCIVAGACGYFDRSGIDSAPAASFIWVKTFKLQVYGPLVLPMLAVFIICACEAIGDVSPPPRALCERWTLGFANWRLTPEY